MYVSKCEHCGYEDKREYFEISENEIRLITPEQLEGLKKEKSSSQKIPRKIREIRIRTRNIIIIVCKRFVDDWIRYKKEVRDLEGLALE